MYKSNHKQIAKMSNQFTKLDIDRNRAINKCLKDFNLEDLLTTSPIAKQTYISGSTALQIINDSNDSVSDLDIYLDIYKPRVRHSAIPGVADDIAEYFVMKGYKPKFIKAKKIRSYVIMYQMVGVIKSSIVNKNRNNTPDKAYFSLHKHIIKILRMYNKDLDKEIDIIILKPGKRNNIQKLLMDTFDYDVIKNYIMFDQVTKKYQIYAHNYNAIVENKATMTLKHFTNRVLSNIHEFNNFITRYVKYSYMKKFEIIINKTQITIPKFLDILQAYFDNLDIQRYLYKKDKLKIKINRNIKSVEELPKIFRFVKPMQYGSYNSYSYTLRLHMNEKEANRIFVSDRIGSIIFYKGYYYNKLINMIDKTHEEYDNEEAEYFLNIGNDIARTVYPNNIDSCVVCLEDNHIYDIYCGNNHKLCGNCIPGVIQASSNKCPLCRQSMFKSR